MSINNCLHLPQTDFVTMFHLIRLLAIEQRCDLNIRNRLTRINDPNIYLLVYLIFTCRNSNLQVFVGVVSHRIIDEFDVILFTQLVSFTNSPMARRI